MIYDAISVKNIILKVYRDHGIDDASFELDAIDWCGEALEYIGTGMQLTDKEDWVVVSSHRGTLPSDLQYLKSVFVVNDPPLKDNWQSEDMPYDLSALNDYKKYMIERSSNLLHDGIGGPSTDQASDSNYYPTNDFTTIFQELQGQSSESDVLEIAQPETYHIDGGYLKTSFETGLALLAYKGIPTDEDGYPLVPDDVRFREALFWYITKKLTLRGHGGINVDYSMADQMWRKRCGQAKAKGNFPDMDEYEEFLQSWTKMVDTRRFNKGNMPWKLDDPRTDKVEDTSGYRVTEDGVYRLVD